MKNWLEKNYKTLIITAFLVPIITVAIVSISHVTKWYGISNPVSWSIYLSIGVEIAALSALAAISANMGKKVYFPFAIVTIVQFIGNIYFAYSYIDINSQSFRDWVGLVSPLVEFMGVGADDFQGHKRFLAFFAGGMLPIISLSFLHMLIKFTEEDRLNGDKKIFEEKPQDIDAKDIIGEVSRIRLSDRDLEVLEKHLLNPEGPNEALKEAEKKYTEEKIKQRLALVEMMENDQKLGLYDEPIINPLVKTEVAPPLLDEEENNIQPSTSPQNATEMMLTSNSDIIESIPSDDEISDWDVTLMDGLEDEEPFFTEEELEEVLKSTNYFPVTPTEEEIFSTIEPTEEEESRNFSTIEPIFENIFQDEYVPSLSDEEIMEMNQDEFERKLDTDVFDEFVPEPPVTTEDVNENIINVVIDEEVLNQLSESNPIPTPQEQIINVEFKDTLLDDNNDVEKKNN